LQQNLKYRLLCREAFLLAKDMGWEEPTQQYYELMSGTRFCGQENTVGKG